MLPSLEKRFPANWLKAFMMSPGVLFPSAYLLFYFSTSIFLNTGFKNELCRTYSTATHGSRNLSIGSLKADFDCRSVTISGIESSSAGASKNKAPRTIDKFEIRVTDITGFLASTSVRNRSAMAICEKIIAEESLNQ
ncbi:MAG: hypothetical protein HGA77_01875 [Chlorobiaceae bacterium]|nr:hypothetical protein [Chlorobiaceae bacterium]